LTTFVKNLNPITQVKNIASTVFHLGKFVSDITIGAVYLSSYDYQARLQQAATIIDTLTSPRKLCEIAINMTAEQWVDLVSHFAADFVFFGGVHKGAAHLRKIDVIGKTKKNLAVLSKRIRHAIDKKLAKNPVVVTAEGITMQLKDVAKNVGGNVKNTVVTCSKELLTAFNESFIASLEYELELLRYTFNTACKGVGRCADKYVKIDLKHIFTMKPHWNKKGMLDIKGFHHDLGNFVEKSGKILFKNKEMFADGFYSAKLCFQKQGRLITKTFFPAHWTREQVIEAILEALNNFKKSGKVATLKPNGKYQIIEKIKNGIEIEICLTQKGKILTAFPNI
jgi:hypothetical protein